MTASYGPVLVMGATGETGQHVVRILHDKQIPVRAFGRTAAKANELLSDGVDVVVGDLNDDLDWQRLMDGVQAVICTLGARALGDQAMLEAIEYIAVGQTIEQSQDYGVAQFVLMSSIGTEHPQSVPFLSQILGIKRKAELFLSRSRLPYTIVRPGGLTNNPPLNAVLVGRGDTLQGQITRADVAMVLVQALLQPEARNQTIEIINKEGAGPADRPGLFA